jgi:hypothetical protein
MQIVSDQPFRNGLDDVEGKRGDRRSVLARRIVRTVEHDENVHSRHIGLLQSCFRWWEVRSGSLQEEYSDERGVRMSEMLVDSLPIFQS